MIRAKVQAECASTAKTTLVGWRELNSSNPWSGTGSPASLLEPHGPLCHRAQVQEELSSTTGCGPQTGDPAAWELLSAAWPDMTLFQPEPQLRCA